MTPPDHDLKHAWRAQPQTLTALPVAWLEAQVQATRSQIQGRNRREFWAAAAAVPVFGLYLWFFPAWASKLGAALVILASLWVMLQIHRRGANLPLPEDLAAQALPYQRAQLVRQREALHSVWRWYLAPLLPGLLLFGAGMYDASLGWGLPLGLDGLVLLVFGGIHAVNRRAAAQLQPQIEALDALAR